MHRFGWRPFNVLPAERETKFIIKKIRLQMDDSPIPTIDEFSPFIGLGAVRLPPPPAGISCVRLCGVRGMSHLEKRPRENSQIQHCLFK